MKLTTLYQLLRLRMGGFTPPPQRLFSAVIYHIKGKSVPLQAWSGPEGSRKLRFPDFMTTAQEGGKRWPRGFQEVKVPRFHDNGTGRW